jgi:hypothetical protein
MRGGENTSLIEQRCDPHTGKLTSEFSQIPNRGQRRVSSKDDLVVVLIPPTFAKGLGLPQYRKLADGTLPYVYTVELDLNVKNFSYLRRSHFARLGYRGR